MRIEQKLNLKLHQQLVMTPQLQQAIKLLQLNHIELSELVSQEIVENPVLEEEQEGRTDPLSELKQSEASATPDDPNAEGNREQTEIDWERYLDNYSSGPRTGGEVRRDNDELPGYEQTLTRGATLGEHLLWQIQMVEVSGDVLRGAVAIVGNLNGDGYLMTPLSEVQDAEGLSEEMVLEGLALVQTLDPLGVGARDLGECLLIPARVAYPDDRVLLSILSEYMAQVAKRDFRAIARGLRVSQQRVIDAMRTITLLEPKPGRPFTDEEPRYITPDISVIKSRDGFVIQLNEDGIPKLRVSEYYRQVLTVADKKEKEYIREKLRSAQWLIRSIFQRQRTIYKVTESIVKQQREFFEEGLSQLKPMILRDVAEDIEMHESTVSRVTTNKYVHTPHGTFPLKFFFNSGIQRAGGGDVASEMVKQRIKAMVGEEDPRKPLSDSAIVKLLGSEDITIARRTVAKYRDMLGISSSSQRRRHY
ncbi:MAG: RNA polymerase factor sigma-54 [Myxococcota bacterium]|nr:RNA polymerase factor sigma-54 [Myxococcota bacterium]